MFRFRLDIWQEYLMFPTEFHRTYMIPVCPTTGHTEFDHLVQVLTSKSEFTPPPSN